MTQQIPHMRIVVAASLVAVMGYFGFSLWAVLVSEDATVIGDVIGTWKSFAVLAFGFWLGSSSGGKQQPGGPPPADVAEAASQVAHAADAEADKIKGEDK